MSSHLYPGNPALPAETRQRVISTFRQSVELFRNGNRDDAFAGCDFILKLDPLFDPAKRFIEHLEQPASTLDLDALLATVAGSDVLEEARAALDGRDFARALDLTSDILRSDFTNMDAQQIAEEAQSKLEAAPFIDQFVKSARSKIQSGNANGAASDLEKARQLDDGHPLVRQLEAEISGGAGGSDAGFDIGGDFASPFSSGFSSPDPFAASAPVSGFGMPSFGSDYGQSTPSDAPPTAFGDPFAAPDAAPAAAPSFVVDAPNTSGSQASDFGFTFEEEQPGGPPDPGFGNPFGEARVPGAGDTFDFATASVETTPDDQENINRYLKEGDAAYDAGEYQRAIDTWSKIFLIDVTNDDASHRIEKARAKRQEIDRHIEELVVAGTLAFEKRDLGTATAKFQEVLTLDPSHFNARQYLDQIESGGAAAAPASSSPTAPGSDFFDEDEAAMLKEAPLVPPEAAAAKKKVVAAPVQKKTARRLPLIPMIVGLVVLAGAGYFAWTKFGGGSAAGDPVATKQIFSKADQLAQQRKFDEAIALLAGVSNDDPEHDRALEMISDLRERKAQGAGTIGGRPAAVVFAEFVAKGREAYAAGDYLSAKDMFDKARAIQTLPADVQPLYQTSTQQVAKLENAIVLLREGKYPDGIANLQSLLQQDPDNVSVRQLLSKAHFNYGVSYLQQDMTGAAIAEFDNALGLNPNDADAKRSRDLAAKYDGQAKDLLYRIYVKYLPARPI